MNKQYFSPTTEQLNVRTDDLLDLNLSKTSGGGPQLTPGRNIFEEEGDQLPESPDVWAE